MEFKAKYEYLKEFEKKCACEIQKLTDINDIISGLNIIKNKSYGLDYREAIDIVVKRLSIYKKQIDMLKEIKKEIESDSLSADSLKHAYNKIDSMIVIETIRNEDLVKQLQELYISCVAWGHYQDETCLAIVDGAMDSLICCKNIINDFLNELSPPRISEEVRPMYTKNEALEDDYEK